MEFNSGFKGLTSTLRGVNGLFHFHVSVLVKTGARYPSNRRPESPLSSLDILEKIPMLFLPAIEPRLLGRSGQIFCYFGQLCEYLKTRNLFSSKGKNILNYLTFVSNNLISLCRRAASRKFSSFIPDMGKGLKFRKILFEITQDDGNCPQQQ